MMTILGTLTGSYQITFRTSKSLFRFRNFTFSLSLGRSITLWINPGKAFGKSYQNINFHKKREITVVIKSLQIVTFTIFYENNIFCMSGRNENRMNNPVGRQLYQEIDPFYKKTFRPVSFFSNMIQTVKSSFFNKRKSFIFGLSRRTRGSGNGPNSDHHGNRRSKKWSEGFQDEYQKYLFIRCVMAEFPFWLYFDHIDGDLFLLTSWLI